ncbi:MAG: hypothetical protein ACMUEL_00315 [Flavobacteriales bacterium Tduv]
MHERSLLKFCKSIYCIVFFGVKNKKIRLYTQKTAQIRFSELYMEGSTRRNEIFKRLNILIHWKGMEKEIRKIYQKG